MSEFKKFDQGKLRWSLMPSSALEEVLKVLEFGASRYGDFNWLENAEQVKWSRYLNALERHLIKFKDGKNLDEDSNLLELAHIVTNALMLLQYQVLKVGIDDRDFRIGKKFGRLRIIKLIEIRHKSERIYEMECDCGNIKNISYNNVQRGNTTSCGCFLKEISGNATRTHGMSDTALYNRYRTMINRCTDEKHIQYKDYGGRGISVCSSWMSSFENFFNDMGNPPTPKHQLDRINNNGGYSKDNCRWVTAKENIRNNSRTKKYIYLGNSYTIGELSDKFNINEKCLAKRLRVGWDLEKAIKTPSRKQTKNQSETEYLNKLATEKLKE